jgi:hypothetical protein
MGSSGKRSIIFLKLSIFCLGFQMHNLLINCLTLVRNYEVAAFFYGIFAGVVSLLQMQNFHPH